MPTLPPRRPVGTSMSASTNRPRWPRSASSCASQLKLMGIGMLLFLLAEALIYRKVASPIRRLSGAVRAARETDAREPVSVWGTAEVQTLAEDVNALDGVGAPGAARTAPDRGELPAPVRDESASAVRLRDRHHALRRRQCGRARHVRLPTRGIPGHDARKHSCRARGRAPPGGGGPPEERQARCVDALGDLARQAQGRIGVRCRGHHPRPCLRGPGRAHGDGTRRHGADGVRARPAPQRGSLPRPVRERERPDRRRRSRWPVDRRQRDVPPCPRLHPGGDGRDRDQDERLRRAGQARPVGRRPRPEARRRRVDDGLRERAHSQRRMPDPSRDREPADRRGRRPGRDRGDLPRHQRAQTARGAAAAGPAARGDRPARRRRRPRLQQPPDRDQRLRRGCCSKAGTAPPSPSSTRSRPPQSARPSSPGSCSRSADARCCSRACSSSTTSSRA